MSKRLPYFQFEPAEYLTGDIMFCSMAAQGLFNQICCLYWQRDCELTLVQAKKRLQNENLFDELISEAIIKIDGEHIIINFLDNQHNEASKKSATNSENGKKGAEARRKKREENSQALAPLVAPLEFRSSETLALREEDIREEEKKENNILLEKEPKEVKKKNPKPENFGLEIILPFASLEFKNAWDEWKEYKLKEHKFKFATPISEGKQLKLLERLSEGHESKAIALIDNAIARSWKGFHVESNQQQQFTPNGKSNIGGAIKPSTGDPRLIGRQTYD